MTENYFAAIKANFKHYLAPHLLISIIFLFLMPIFFGVENLDNMQTAKLLEIFVSIVGIICLVPIFLPEQYGEIRDLIYTKYMAMIKIYMIRILLGLLSFAFTLLVVMILLSFNNNQFPFIPYYLGTLATGIFLGSLGILFYTFFDNIAIAYMLPLVYYISNFGGSSKYFGKFILFSMSRGSMEEKYYLAIGGIVLLCLSLFIKNIRQWR